MAKLWKFNLEEREGLRLGLKSMSRRQLEDQYLDQAEQVQRFLRAIKKLKQAITELTITGH